MIDKLLTIFTPTYNRVKTLPRLYESLCNQTSKNFCWLIVDDGSTDGTEAIVNEWKKENKVLIEYHRQVNQGKSAAFNVGIRMCDTELFTCVDSDDYLSHDAVDTIANTWSSSKGDSVGILCLREVSSVSERMKSVELYTTLRSAYLKYGLKGDTMLIHKSSVIKQYEFPVFPGEKFVPEDYLYDKIDRDGELFFLNKVLYKGNYLSGGYTSGMAKLIKNNPLGYNEFICQRLRYDETIKQKFTDSIRHIAINIILKSTGKKTTVVYPIYYYLLYPLGYLFYCKRYKHI